ncbi:MAG: tellurite resistance TerB family protein [Alphaproteobacteria bacterium]
MSASRSTQTALISIMVFVSAADRDMTDAELRTMGDLVRTLPVFEDFPEEALILASQSAAEIAQKTESLEQAIAVVRESLPDTLCETAYALACDIAAADGLLASEEIRALELIRFGLGLDRLTAAAIERAAKARFTTG